MSALGHKRTNHFGPKSADVRYAPNNGQILRRSIRHGMGATVRTLPYGCGYFFAIIGVARAAWSSTARSARSFISRRTRRDLIIPRIGYGGKRAAESCYRRHRRLLFQILVVGD